MAVCLFGVGFISPYWPLEDWFVLRMKYFPQKLTFDNKVNFNEELLRKSFDKAVEYIDGQKSYPFYFIRISRKHKFAKLLIRSACSGR